VDYTDPVLPPDTTAEKIHAGIALAVKTNGRTRMAC
jgi:hypothetical protein